jgi:23S rRNA-/tRNA-specific pseudouridylate synthase
MRRPRKNVPLPLVDILIPQGLAGERLDRAIARLNPRVSRMEARRMIAGGSVFVDEHRTRIASRLLHVGQRLVCYRLATATAEMKLPQIVCDHPDFFVIDKPAGIAVEATRAGDVATVARWLSDQGLPALITHRLDVPVSGALVVARTPESQVALNRLFAVHGVERQYLAGVTPAPLWNDHVIESPLDGHPARTLVRVLERTDTNTAALLEVRLETGRFRQIRRHLASEGFPVAGDREQPDAAGTERILLHAFRVAFPWGDDSIDVRVPPSADFGTALARLGLGTAAAAPATTVSVAETDP